MQRTAIVIPTYNAMPQLAATLAELAWAESRDDVEVVLADSGSRDATLSHVKARAPWATVVRGDQSMWWAAATNIGCRHAIAALGCETLCLLNHDCEMPEHSFDVLLEGHRQSRRDIVCSRVLVKHGDRVLFAGGGMAWTGMLTMPGFDAPAMSRFASRDVVWCGGMGVIFSAALWLRLGGFDAATFPHYLADSDFCLRARHAGARVRYLDDAEIVNDRASTGLQVTPGDASVRRLFGTFVSPRSPYRLAGVLRFYRRHLGARWPLAVAHLYAIHVGVSLKRIAAACVQRRASLAP